MPKKTFAPRAGGEKSIGALTIVGLALFFAAAVVLGGVYLNSYRLERAISGPDGLEISLERANKAFEKDLLTRIMRVDAKIKAGELLLLRHKTISPIFSLLNELTLKTIRFDSFAYDGSGEELKLALAGKAQSYKSIALQSQAYSENRFLHNVVFSNLTLDQEGKVAFTLVMNVEPSLLSYTESKRE